MENGEAVRLIELAQDSFKNFMKSLYARMDMDGAPAGAYYYVKEAREHAEKLFEELKEKMEE